MLLSLEPVGAETFETAVGLVVIRTVLVTLKQLEDIIDDDGLEVDLLLVVEVVGFGLDLGAALVRWVKRPAAGTDLAGARARKRHETMRASTKKSDMAEWGRNTTALKRRRSRIEAGAKAHVRRPKRAN